MSGVAFCAHFSPAFFTPSGARNLCGLRSLAEPTEREVIYKVLHSGRRKHALSNRIKHLEVVINVFYLVSLVTVQETVDNISALQHDSPLWT